MKKTLEYMEEAKEKLGLKTDLELTQWLGQAKGAISNWKSGKNVMDDYAAARIADVLGIDRIEVITAANAEREEMRGKVRRAEYWKTTSPCALCEMVKEERKSKHQRRTTP